MSEQELHAQTQTRMTDVELQQFLLWQKMDVEGGIRCIGMLVGCLLFVCLLAVVAATRYSPDLHCYWDTLMKHLLH